MFDWQALSVESKLPSKPDVERIDAAIVSIIRDHLGLSGA